MIKNALIIAGGALAVWLIIKLIDHFALLNEDHKYDDE
jgi:hypothetical protein